MPIDRFCICLIPPPGIATQIEGVWGELNRQFGLSAARRFMVHATLKGFFRLHGDIHALRTELNELLQNRPCFEIKMNSVGTFGRRVIKIGLKSWNLQTNHPTARLRTLHKDTYNIIQQQPVDEDQVRGVAGMGYIDPACEFTNGEYIGRKFSAHFTLAFKDIPAQQFDQVLAVTRNQFQNVQPRTFSQGTKVGLYRFTSTDWAGDWWQTLNYNMVADWALL